MATWEIIQSKLMWTILGSWVITLPVYWLEALKSMFIAYLLIEAFDVLTWIVSARKLKQITSKAWINWLIKKWVLLCFLALIIVAVWSLRSTLIITNNYFWLIPIVFVWLFSYFGIISILENLSIIFWDSNEWKLFKVLNYLCQLLFNLSLDKLKIMTEEKLKNKFNSK